MNHIDAQKTLRAISNPEVAEHSQRYHEHLLPY